MFTCAIRTLYDHPVTMVKVLVYAYCVGVPSSRRIPKRLHEDIAFRVLVPNMLEGIDQGIRGLRIGLDEEYISGNTDPQVVASVLEGIRVLEGLGAVIVPI